MGRMGNASWGSAGVADADDVADHADGPLNFFHINLLWWTEAGLVAGVAGPFFLFRGVAGPGEGKRDSQDADLAAGRLRLADRALAVFRDEEREHLLVVLVPALDDGGAV